MRATEKQINLIKKLIDSKEGEYTIFAEEQLKKSSQIEFCNETQSTEVVYEIDSEFASELISNLLKLEDAEFRPLTEKQYYLISKFISKGKKKNIFKDHNIDFNVAKINSISFEEATALISDLFKK